MLARPVPLPSASEPTVNEPAASVYVPTLGLFTEPGPPLTLSVWPLTVPETVHVVPLATAADPLPSYWRTPWMVTGAWLMVPARPAGWTM